MHVQKPIALEFQVDDNELIKVIFVHDYEVHIRTHSIKVGYKPVIRNIQLFRFEDRIGQFDADIVESSRRDRHADVFHPQMLTFGDANEFLAFWKAALKFIDDRYRDNRAHPALDADYCHSINHAAHVEHSCKPHIKVLEQSTLQEQRKNDRRSRNL